MSGASAGVAVSALLALVGHGLTLWLVMGPFMGSPGGRQIVLQTLVPSALPFFLLLTTLLVVAVLRRGVLFPWGLLASPWLLVEAVGGVQNGLQPALTGLLPTASIVGSLGDVGVVVALIAGTVAGRRR